MCAHADSCSPSPPCPHSAYIPKEWWSWWWVPVHGVWSWHSEIQGAKSWDMNECFISAMHVRSHACTHMYACMSTYMCVCVCVCVCMSDMRTHVQMHAHTRAHMHAHGHKHTHLHTCMPAHTYTHKLTWASIGRLPGALYTKQEYQNTPIFPQNPSILISLPPVAPFKWR